MSSSNKKIDINLNPPEKNTIKKEVNKRIITHSEKWKQIENQLTPEIQLSYIRQLSGNNVVDKEPCEIILKHISQKISGYRSQDIKKSLYEKEKLIDVEYVLKILENAENICYYCKKPVEVLYENVREPKQWSLDRINNDMGHIKENIVLACLQCNVGRKTMHQERYAFTKQLVIIKKDN